MVTPIDPSDMHYRLIETPSGEAAVACVQDFDYPDYTFVNDVMYSTQEEAVLAARNLSNPREIMADLIYRNGYPDPMSPRIQPFAERPRWERAMVYRQVDAVMAAGFNLV